MLAKHFTQPAAPNPNKASFIPILITNSVSQVTRYILTTIIQ